MPGSEEQKKDEALSTLKKCITIPEIYAVMPAISNVGALALEGRFVR